jgi:uncharacterized protein (DUF39 family)
MKKIIFLMSMLVSYAAQGAYHCNASINKVLLYANGNVNVNHSGRNNYTIICSLKQEYKGVSVATCAMWASLLDDIKKDNGQAIFYYGGEGQCSSLPTYGSAPAPVYIGRV